MNPIIIVVFLQSSLLLLYTILLLYYVVVHHCSSWSEFVWFFRTFLPLLKWFLSLHLWSLPSMKMVWGSSKLWFHYSVAHTTHKSISFDDITHSKSLGPWVLHTGATDHIIGNKFFFSSISTFDYLPSITMANGSRVWSHGVGTIHLFPSLSIDNVLYVLRSPFNILSISRLTHSLVWVKLLSHSCLISSVFPPRFS